MYPLKIPRVKLLSVSRGSCRSRVHALLSVYTVTLRGVMLAICGGGGCSMAGRYPMDHKACRWRLSQSRRDPKLIGPSGAVRAMLGGMGRFNTMVR